ncbi:MAG TPA: reverse transcriptase/maturase family protein [Candidatus Paceibacterota bacterium]|nr:reverse transcriptase/maturase family protein [Candidatus Paceibacterota bacterium]
MRIYTNLFNKLITPENLFFAWEEFRRDKKKKEDVLLFEKNLEREIFSLHRDLKSFTYRHSGYAGFYISDPKRRHIHKAQVRDRVLHHAIMSILYPLYEKVFIHNSFSCRIGKGTHKGVEALRSMLYKASKNNTRNVYILKCDIEKFFDSISHEILLSVLSSRIKDQELMNLLVEVVGSFTSDRSTLFDRCGVPIGNLTSQLFANVYMDVFDQFIKHDLKVKYYARYTDDFVIVSESKEYLVQLLPQIRSFLKEKLKIQIHPKKITITKFGRGIDYLGYVLFPHFTLVRKRTQKRALRKINEKILLYKKEEISKDKVHATLMSYLGVLFHADTFRFSEKLKNEYFFNVSNFD